MLDIKFIRENPEAVKKACRDKNVKVDVDEFLSVDKKRREALQKLELILSKKNKGNREIAESKTEDEKKKVILSMKELDKESDELSRNLKEIEKEFNGLILQIPNLPQEDVPVGKDEKRNVVLRKVGKIPRFNFEPKNYLEIAEKLDLIDVQRAAKISGTRFGFLRREVVLMQFALLNLTVKNLIREKFIPIIPPVMLKEEMARGTGYFEGADREEAYFIPEDNLFLAGTSEQPLIAMHADEVFEEKELPKRYVGFSTCFRRESGSYGKDTKGILRVHQFNKIEMVSFCRPEDSKKEHAFLLSMEEKLMKPLGIPYQVIRICTGDLGRPAAAKYDIEAWLPSENRYRETHSTSNCTDFQARRLNIRFRAKSGELKFVHTLNGTAFSERPILAIIENYQTKEGSIKIPKVLQKYTGFKEIRR